jgi:NodT family efflux transporter outer membrane factor (OMF) lipoprotein
MLSLAINYSEIRLKHSPNVLTFGLFFLFLFAGCSQVGPDFIKPDAPVSGQWLESSHPNVDAGSADYSEWWTIFDDPVLDSLIQQAYQQNLTLQIAGIRILEARAQLGIAVGNIYPQLQQARADISHVELSDHRPNVSPTLDTSFRDANVGLDIGWELDLWGRFRRGIEAADADLLASIADYDDVLVSLTANVATAYTLIRIFEERLVIAGSNVEIQKSSLEIANDRYRNGTITELDVKQAQTLLLNTQATIPALEIGLQQSKHALSTLLGMPPGGVEKLLNSPGAIPTAPAEVAVGVPAELLRRRPDIRLAELQTAAQSARIGIAESDLYPHFSLLGSIGLRASDTFNSELGDLFQLNSIEAFGGPTLTWDVFNYGRIKNNVRVQDARLQQLVVNYQNTVLEALREVEDALVGFLRTQEQVSILAQSVEAAQRSVDLALLQYTEGIADYQRVLDTQEALFSQQELLTSRRGDIATSLIAMYRALGGGWELRSGKPFVQEKTIETMRKRSDWGQLLDTTTDELSTPVGPETPVPKPDW